MFSFIHDCACAKKSHSSHKLTSEMAYRFSDISDIGKYWHFSKYQIFTGRELQGIESKSENIGYQVSADVKISDIGIGSKLADMPFLVNIE